jgi:hypothetical protein
MHLLWLAGLVPAAGAAVFLVRRKDWSTAQKSDAPAQSEAASAWPGFGDCDSESVEDTEPAVLSMTPEIAPHEQPYSERRRH